ncbi:MAG: hypothetical protein V3R81_06440 [Gammaproteobacteria bacterium]
MNLQSKSWSWILLFTTTATLTCCALPILLVTLGLGTAVATMASAAPWLITLSMYKGWVFAVSGGLIAAAAWAVYRPGRVCPADPELAAACARADKWNQRFIWVSTALWAVGFFSAFLLIRL